MSDGQAGSVNPSFTPYIPDKSVMTDAPFNPGQRRNLNFEGIPVNEGIAGDFPLDKSVIESKEMSASNTESTRSSPYSRLSSENEGHFCQPFRILGVDGHCSC